MKKMRVLITLAGALCVLAFASGAQAQSEDAAVDWDEAIEFAEVTDTYVENGVKWVTWYDELQGVMWSQPADAAPEAVKAYMAGDQETLKDLGLEDFCVVQWPVPYYMYLLDNDGSRYLDAGDFMYYGPGALGESVHRIWKGWTVTAAFLDVDTSVESRVRGTVDYLDEYNGRFYDHGSGWDTTCDNEEAYYSGGYYRYPVYEAGAVDDWNYYYLTCTAVAKHEVYICDYTRYIEVHYCTYALE